MSDSDSYKQKKQQLASILTVFGRKPVHEALEDYSLHISRLHLADSNKSGGTIDTILDLAQKRNIETVYHSRQALARISKNGKQDQGVALDISIKGFCDYQEYLQEYLDAQKAPHGSFIALDNITNPQNLGMIIRTVCASPVKALLLPRKGCAKIDSLVIKASAGTLFKANILWCDALEDALRDFKKTGAQIIALSGEAKQSFWQYKNEECSVFILGNETQGVSKEIGACCNHILSIPMENAVESLNVAVTAGIIAFHHRPQAMN